MKFDKLVVASGNAHKIEEIKSIFSDVEIIPMNEAGFTDEIEETGLTFKENALIKAQAVCSALGVPALADDSGLCVEALGGAPGIYSARYSGKGAAENRKLLLKELDGKSDRRAAFKCCMCLATPDGKTYFGEGETRGEIMEEEKGCGGFGYDPLFYSYDLKKGFAEATAEEKNSVSHRCRALDDLRSKL